MTDVKEFKEAFVTCLKLIVVGGSTLPVLYLFKSDMERTAILSVIFVVAVAVLGTPLTTATLLLLLSAIAAVAQYVLIRFVPNTFSYQEPGEFLVPSWVLPLQTICFLVITEVISLRLARFVRMVLDHIRQITSGRGTVLTLNNEQQSDKAWSEGSFRRTDISSSVSSIQWF